MRLGKYSGKLYTEDEVKNMQECGVCISDEQANNEKWINEQHLHDLKDCIPCCGCPMAQKNSLWNWRDGQIDINIQREEKTI